MRNIIQSLKSIKIKQVLTAFLVGCLLLISTACSQDSVAKTGNKAEVAGKNVMSKDYDRGAASDTYDRYDANQQYKGGMNSYNDDRRYDSGTAAKAKTLVDTAKRRQVDNLGDYVDNVGDRAKSTVKEAKRDIPRTLKDNKEDAVDYVQNKSNKLQRNLSKVPGGAKDVFDEATDTAQNAINDANKATKKNTQEIKDNFEDLS
jgi:F0F1-type ATP synthase membrane subunit b/b'